MHSPTPFRIPEQPEGPFESLELEDPEQEAADDEDADYGPMDHAPPPPSLDNLKDEIRRETTELYDMIIQDRIMKWSDETSLKLQPNYETYHKIVTDLHEKEDQLNMCLTEQNVRQSPGPNLLQSMLSRAKSFSPTSERLHKAKFLLQLLADVDPTQLTPKCEPKLLHATAEFDIYQQKEDKNFDSDLTIFTIHLLGLKAASKIGETNAEKANILHLAIQYDFKGVEEIIQKADAAAFLCQRMSPSTSPPSTDAGNTPLHDALGFNFEEKFMRPGPACQVVRYAALKTPGTRRSSVVSKQDSAEAAAINHSAQPLQQRSNQARPRVSPVTAVSPDGPRKPSMGMCQVCTTAYKRSKEAMERRTKVINEILARKPGVNTMTVHNSAGLSPYLYLRAASEYHKQQQASQVKSEPATGPMSTLTPAPMQLHRQGTNLRGAKEVDEMAKDSSEAESGDLKNGMISSALEARIAEEEAAKSKKKHMQASITASNKASMSQNRAHGARESSQRAAGEKVKAAVKNRTIMHREQDLERTDIGSEYILSYLRELVFELDGYKNACECLFQGRNIRNPSFLGASDGQMRSFSLEGRQRVNGDTISDFDFLRFEPTMASVVLSLEYTPEDLETLQRTRDGDEVEIWMADEENLRQVFNWLKKDKKVQTILSLTVKDNPKHFCSDYTVELCLRELEVMYLNWNRPDMCANSISLPKSLLEISLYWTGLNAVLWSWSDTEGLRTLKKLRKVHLYVQKSAEPEETLNQKVEDFIDRVEKWPKTLRQPKIIPTDKEQLRAREKSGGHNANTNLRMHSWIQAAKSFAQKLNTLYRDKADGDRERCYVKIALLDDGVDPNYEHNGVNLHHAGWPSVDSEDSGEGSHSFYVSTNQHGSKMAALIRKVCPFVTIYVAKLGVQRGEELHRRSFSLGQATEALKWAIEEGVDIISMSWTAKQVPGPKGNGDEIRKLENAMSDAVDKKILLFGAASDVKGSPEDKWYPCDSDHVWSIGATDKEYDVKKYVNLGKGVKYLFPGEHVLEGGRKEDIDVGNSGATALAAGLAALVMACMRIEGYELPEERKQWMENVMSKVFGGDVTGKGVVHVINVLKMDEKVGLRSLVRQFVGQVR